MTDKPQLPEPVAWSHHDRPDYYCSAADKVKMPTWGGQWPAITKAYSDPLYTADQAQAYADACVAAERERCKNKCEEIEGRYWAAFKGKRPHGAPIGFVAAVGSRGNPYIEGMSDGAGECAAAILKEPT